MKSLNTSDLYKRLCELEGLRDAVTSAQEELDEHKNNPPEEGLEREPAEELEWDERKEELEAARDDAESQTEGGDAEELAELETIQQEIGFHEFKGGAQLIPVDSQEWTDYVRESVSEMTDWRMIPLIIKDNIDWDGVAEDLASDCTVVSYQGEEYYIRA